MKFRIDLHVHSRYSGDTDSDPEEAVLRAISRGLQGIAFTEHYSYSASEYVGGLREKYGESILILRGVEFSAARGTVSYSAWTPTASRLNMPRSVML